MPTPNVSIVDLVLQVEKKTFAEEVNEAFREAARGPSKGAQSGPMKCRSPLVTVCYELWSSATPKVSACSTSE